MRAQLAQREARLRGRLPGQLIRGRPRHQDLPATSRRRDPRRDVHVVPDVAVLGDQRRAAVDADPDLERTTVENTSDRGGGAERARCGFEREEERVPLGVHLDAAVRPAGRPNEVAVSPERPGVPLRAESLQQPRRALDVTEKKSQIAAW
jgi:hypothetical protein